MNLLQAQIEQHNEKQSDELKSILIRNQQQMQDLQMLQEKKRLSIEAEESGSGGVISSGITWSEGGSGSFNTNNQRSSQQQDIDGQAGSKK